MHPFHHGFFHHHHFRRGGPSRLFWFILGAGVATYWHRSYEMHAHGHYWHCLSHANRRRIDDAQVQQHPVTAANTTASVPSGTVAVSTSSMPTAFPSPFDSGMQPIAPQPPRWAWANASQSSDGTFGWNQKEWEEDKERLRDFQRRAQDTMVEMSESTLDSILSTVESMKKKLAEHRTLREQHQRQYEEEFERARKEPRRYV